MKLISALIFPNSSVNNYVIDMLILFYLLKQVPMALYLQILCKDSY